MLDREPEYKEASFQSNKENDDITNMRKKKEKPKKKNIPKSNKMDIHKIGIGN